MSITYVQNHLPYSSLPDDMSPMEAAFGTVPDVSRLRTLGCDCYTVLDIEGQDKLLIKANPPTLLGYFMKSLSYRVLIWSTGRIAHLRNVGFNEESITNGAMSGVANSFIDSNKRYESTDDKTSDRTVGSTPVKFEESDDMGDVLISPREYIQSTAILMIVLAAY
jgi:hypothetical protein